MNPQQGQLQSVDSLRALLEGSIPTEEIEYAFAYGSGVLLQQTTANYNADKLSRNNNMIDFVVAVRDSYRFHQQNVLQNSHHYAPMMHRMTNNVARRIEWWQRHHMDNSFFRNPGIYYNNVDRSFKYGVVQVEDLQDDLLEWKYLYLAGRMHKPVVPLIDRQPQLAESQSQRNLPSALSASLILLSLDDSRQGVLDEALLYEKIASLSYSGDPRMAAGAEDPKKVSKLVHSPGQLLRFRNLYADSLQELQRIGLLTVDHPSNEQEVIPRSICWEADSVKAHRVLWAKLPRSLQGLMYHHDGNDNTLLSARALQLALPKIVAPAARYQSLKGLASAGFRKSVVYAMRKLSKGVLAR